jgi:hypothetical protein
LRSFGIDFRAGFRPTLLKFLDDGETNVLTVGDFDDIVIGAGEEVQVLFASGE